MGPSVRPSVSRPSAERATSGMESGGFPPLFVNRSPLPSTAFLSFVTIAVCCANRFGGRTAVPALGRGHGEPPGGMLGNLASESPHH